MKKVLMILVGVLFILVAATEGYCDKPYLVCDPEAGVTDYQVVDNGAAPVVSQALADGSLYYDLSNITEGSHHISVISCNLWGCSDAAVIDFIKALPGKGKNVKIVVVKP